ncbi:MAG: alpha/beta fold hydrolase [Halorientalis sp.]
MKLRNVVAGAVGGIGVTAAANKLLAWRGGELAPPLEGKHGTFRWRGFDVAYTEAGDPDDPDMLFVHGINASGSSHEFRGIFQALAEDYHVIAPDLPGFGRSDRPPLSYSGSLYTTFVEDFTAEMTDDPIVVASSLGGAYAAVAAKSVPVRQLVLLSPTAETMPWRKAWLRTLVRSPILGEALFNAITSKPSIRHFNADHGYYDTDNITAELVDYQWQTAHQPGGRFAPASFISGFLNLDIDLGEVLSSVDAPITIVWGRQAEISPLEHGKALAETADARLIVFDESDLQPHAEHPQQFVEQVIHGEGLGTMTDIQIEEPGSEDARTKE